MAKQGGLGMVVNVDDSGGNVQNISNDITNLTFSTPRSVQDVTGINSSAMERILNLADFSITLNGVFNTATNLSHDVFKTVPSTSVARTVTITHASKSLPNETMFTDYALSRPQSGELTFTAPGVLNSTTVPTWA